MIMFVSKMRLQSTNTMAALMAPLTDELMVSDAVSAGEHFTRVFDGHKYSRFLSPSDLGQMLSMTGSLTKIEFLNYPRFSTSFTAETSILSQPAVMEREVLNGKFELSGRRGTKNGSTELKNFQLTYSQNNNESKFLLFGK